MRRKRIIIGEVLGLVFAAANCFGQTLTFLQTKASEDGSVQLKWQSQTNRLYRLEFVSALAASNNWQTLDDDMASAITPVTFDNYISI